MQINTEWFSSNIEQANAACPPCPEALKQDHYAPCHKSDFNLNGGPYKMFQMIHLLGTKIFQKILLLKIMNEGFMVNQHSKGVTKSKLELYPHLALQQHIFSRYF